MASFIDDEAREGLLPDYYLPLDYAAKHLGISKSWLYKNQKRLPFIVHVGGRLKVSRKQLAKWMASRKEGKTL